VPAVVAMLRLSMLRLFPNPNPHPHPNPNPNPNPNPSAQGAPCPRWWRRSGSTLSIPHPYNPRTAMQKLRIVILRFGIARQKVVLE
jgi:hypothetical protein